MTTAWWETRWLLSATAWTIAGVGALAFLWAMYRDRSRGRTRCPKCWYDLAGLVKHGTPAPWPITCPECGKKIGHERQTRRTRRHWRLAALALAMMLAAYPIAHIGDAREYGPQRLLPLWLQAVAWPVGEVSSRSAWSSTGVGVPGFDFSLHTGGVCGLGGGSPSPEPLEDIRDRLDDEAPTGWYHRVFVWRLVQAMSIEPGRASRVYCYSSLWNSLRRGAPWRSAREVRESDDDLVRHSLQPSLSGLLRTKEVWVRDETGLLRDSLMACYFELSEEPPDVMETLGSSIVFVGPVGMLQVLDRCDAALRKVVTGGPGSRAQVPLHEGVVSVFRNVADVTDWTDAGDEQLDAMLTPHDRLVPSSGTPEWLGIRGRCWDLCKSILVVVADEETQRQVDVELATLRAERAKELQRVPAD